MAAFFAAAPAASGAELIKGEIVSVGLGGVRMSKGLYRAGCWVPVRVRLENRSGKQFTGYLAVTQPDLDGDKVLSVSGQIILQSDEVAGRDFWLYYWPRPDDDQHGTKMVKVLDEAHNAVAKIGSGEEGKESNTNLAAGIWPEDAESGSRASRWVVVLGPRHAGMASFSQALGGTEGVRRCVLQSANDLPNNVLGLDGVDTIIWEADAIRVQEFAPEFQLKALLEWVKAGGHLIISCAQQWRDIGDPAGPLAALLPLKIAGTRELKVADLASFRGLAAMAGSRELDNVPQLIGVPAEGAQGIYAGNGPFKDQPLVRTVRCGQGVITLITVDIANPEFERRLSERDWTVFWNAAAGWQGDILVKAEVERRQRLIDQGTLVDPMITRNAAMVNLGGRIPAVIDVSEVTFVRLITAILFLAIYWLAAGPIGHLILRHYRVTHWSWWIFGGTVVLAVGIAGLTVTVLQLTSYDVRQKSIVLGTVGSPQVSLISFHGVFAPTSGIVPVAQPETPGLNYIVPLTAPTPEPVKSFADPQSYMLFNDTPWEAGVVFRRTLKKMQSRWTGELPGIDRAGPVTASGPVETPFVGQLTNHSGYDLHGVEIIRLITPNNVSSAHLFYVGEWKNGAVLDLATGPRLETVRGLKMSPVALGDVVNVVGRSLASNGMGGGSAAIPRFLTSLTADDERDILRDHSEEFLWAFWDARAPAADPEAYHLEAVRGLTRVADRSASLRACGAVIIAHAGNVAGDSPVKGPLPIKVNGREVPGKGEILFLWALPISGKLPASSPAAPAAPDSLPAIERQRSSLIEELK